MDIFFSDLDNTLIYSHNRKIRGEKVVAEYLKGREQSFMTRKTYDFLIKSDWLNLVPVTTRTESQYRRINCIGNFNIKYAIVCNGGKLLINGIEDNSWTEETVGATLNQIKELEDATELLKALCGRSEIHRPEIYMSYVSAENPYILCEKLKSLIKGGNVYTEHDRRKVYLFAAAVNKGNAVRRFKQVFGINKTVAAGDDIMDIPMLNEADYALATDKIFDKIDTPVKKRLSGEIISDQICMDLEKMYNSVKIIGVSKND